MLWLGANAGAESIPFQAWHYSKEAYAPELVARDLASSVRTIAVLDPDVRNYHTAQSTPGGEQSANGDVVSIRSEVGRLRVRVSRSPMEATTNSEKSGEIYFLLPIYGRAAGYAATHTLALAAGLAIAGTIGLVRSLQGASLLLASTPFFIAYATRINYADSNANRKVEALAFGTAFAALLFVIVALVAALNDIISDVVTTSFLTFLAAMLTVYGSYAWFYTKSSAIDVLAAKHILVWPSVVTIGMGLYAGTYLSSVDITIVSRAMPVLFLVGLFVATQRLSTSGAARVLWVGGIVAAATVTLLTGVWPALAGLVAFVIISAHLASYEAWRYTAHLASISMPLDFTARSFVATSVAAGLSLSLLPLTYYVSFLTFWGMALFVAVGTIATTTWFARSPTLSQTDTSSVRFWATWKVLFGFLALSVLVGDRLLAIENVAISDGGNFFYFLGAVILVFDTALARRAAPMIRAAIHESDYFTDRFAEARQLTWFTAAAGCFTVQVVALGALSFTSDVDTMQRAAGLFVVAALLNIVALLGGWSDLWSRPFVSILPLVRMMRWPVGIAITSIAGYAQLIRGEIVAGLEIGLPFGLAAGASFVLNDIIDRERDRINGKSRALALGATTVARAQVALLVLLVAFLALVLVFPTEALLLQLIALGGGLLYGLTVRFAPILKGLHAAAVSTLVVAAPITASGAKHAWLLGAGAITVLWARELAMDYQDRIGDAATGIRTMPVRVGSIKAGIVGCLMLIAGATATVSFAMANPGRLSIVVSAFICLLVLGLGITFIRSSRYRNRAIAFAWLPIAMSLLLIPL